MKKHCASSSGSGGAAASESERIREAGQRSLHSTRFLLRHCDSDAEGAKRHMSRPCSSKQPPVSLSDYLARKLHATSTSTSTSDTSTSFPPLPLPDNKQNKFPSSAVHHNYICAFAGPRDHSLGRTGQNKEEASLVIEDSVFKQFRHLPAGGEENGTTVEPPCNDTHAPTTLAMDEQESRKRKNPFVRFDGHENQSGARKHLLTIGEDPKPKPKPKARRTTLEKGSFSNKNPRPPLFNHYESGSGWWDCDREGVDNDEVGCNEMWEGMASTTLGELQWN
ncbi:hypothetical protein Dimus_029866 [Dionaea muscipula]